MTLVGGLETARRPEEFEAIWLRVRSTSPELREASARVARARARIARENAANIPDIDAQLALQHDQATNYTIGSAQIGFMVPVHQRNQGAIAAAQAEYCREVKSYERLELDLRDRLAQAVRDAEVAAQQVETYGEKVVPAAEEGLRLIREGYERGEFDVLRLVTAQQVYADALREYVQAQIDLQRALAVLDGVLLTGGLNQPNQPKGTDTPDTLTEIPKAQ
jgi:cobalt-zinc-cadmium efflux system outer membrane protein